MRTVISIFYTIFVVLIFAQNAPLKKDGDIVNDSSVTENIEKITELNYQKIEEVKSIKAANAEELKEIEKIDQRRKTLLNSIDKTLKKFFNKPIKQTSNSVKKEFNDTKYTTLELSKIPLDSICVEERRSAVFSKKKCTKWEYFKTIKNMNDEKIILKVEK